MMKSNARNDKKMVRQVNRMTVKKYDTSSVPWREYFEVSETFSDTSRTAYAEVFNTVTQGHGDFVTATQHSFNRVRQTMMTGMVSHDNTPPSGYPKAQMTIYGPSEGAVPLHMDANARAQMAYNNALSKAYAKLRSEVDISVDLAQHHKTRKMFKDVGSISTYVRGFNRKTIARNWLMFTYGWRPLAQTLHGSITEMYESAGRLVDVKERSTVRDEFKTRETNSTWNKSHKEEVSARCEIRLRFTPTRASLDQAARLSSLNPVAIAWELMPYSFVVDWFVDVGSFIRNVETALIYGSTRESLEPGSYSTITIRQNAAETWTGIGKAPSNWYYGGSLSGDTEAIRKIRTPLLHLPFPAVPRFRAKLGVSRLLSAAALLNVLLGDKPSKRPGKRISTTKWKKTKKRIENSPSGRR